MIAFPLIISIVVSLIFGVNRTDQVMTDDWHQQQTIIKQSDEQFEALKLDPNYLDLPEAEET